MLAIKTNPRDEGYFEKPLTFDNNGDVSASEFYKKFDDVTGEYSLLKVKETYVNTRNSLGLVSKRTTTTEYYKAGQVVKTIVKEQAYDVQGGYVENQKSRRNLIDQASIWLLSSLISEYEAAQGEAYAQEFLNDVSKDISTYKRGNTAPLLLSISTSIRVYITQGRKDSLDAILNVSYN